MVAPMLVPLDCDDMAGSLVEVIKHLPGFKSEEDCWIEVDPTEYPEVGAVYIGEIDTWLEVSVAKLRTGAVKLTFAYDLEDEELEDYGYLNNDHVTCAIAWEMPGILDEFTDDGNVVLSTTFNASGDLAAILDNDELMGILRRTDDLTGTLLFGSPQEFMTLGGKYTSLSHEKDSNVEMEYTANDFVKELVFRVGTSTPYDED